MRSALILPGGVGRDGVNLVIPALLDLIEGLAAEHELLVVALEQEPKPASYRLRGASVVCLGQDGPRPLRFGRRAARLMGALRAFRPEVIHSFWFGPTSSLALLAGRALGVPVVASLGGGEFVALPQIGYGGQLSARGRLHVALAMRGAAAVTAGSRYALGPLLRRRPDARLVPLGVRAPVVAPVARPAGPPWRLLQVASINRVKGPELLLAAVATAREALRAATGHPEPLQLDWVGQDVLGGEAQRLAAALGLAVSFHGWQPHARALELCNEASLYVQSSHHESQGVAVCEAAAAGLPTVGTAVGLVAELAPGAAVAVPPGDAAALGRAIVATLLDPTRREAIGRAAQLWASEHDAGWSARRFAAIYTELLAGSRAQRTSRGVV